MRFIRHSLLLRIALPFALLLALTLGGLYLYLSAFLQNTYTNTLENNLQSETRLVADRMAQLIIEEPGSGAVEERAKLYAGLLGVRVTIIDPTGNVLGESSTDPREMENHLDRPEVQRAIRQQVSTEIRYSNTLQTRMLYAAAPILNNGKLIGVARLAVSLKTVSQNEQVLQRSVLVATALAALLAILLAALVARYTIVPIQHLSRTAQRVASGQLDEIASTARDDEIGQLQQSIQYMAHQLKAQITDLRAERGKMEAVLANMTNGVIMVDQNGLVQLINPAAARLFHLVEEPSPRKSLIEVARHHQLVELWQKTQATGEQQTITLETAPDRLFIQVIATPLDHSLPGMSLLVFQDLTRVRRLETVRRDFVSNVSHELRTPLASLKALTETLQEGALEDPPAAQRFLQRMNTEIDNLTQIVQELLELSQIESNRVPLQRIPVMPCELAAPAIERMSLQAERAGLRLQMDCPENLPPVKADPERIEQVLVNLLHNAIKFTRPGGEITVSASGSSGVVVFAVKDTGIGIPAEKLPRIFERFYKADRARSGGGTGLGLSIARNIIEAHGGSIWAESTENVGSTFYFTLPIS